MFGTQSVTFWYPTSFPQFRTLVRPPNPYLSLSLTLKGREGRERAPLRDHHVSPATTLQVLPTYRQTPPASRVAPITRWNARAIKSSKTRPRQRHESSPFAYGPLGPRQSLASATIKTGESVARRQCASDRRERNMKTYQISDDRLVVVKKNLVVIKQKGSDKSFEITPGRLVLCMFVTKYCISRFVCIGGCLN